MYRMRLALGALVVALVVGVSGALTSSSGQLPQQPTSGVTYGGEKAFDTVWLRLHPSREVIAAVEIPWEERQTVTGTITAERASGTIRAVGITTKPNGRVGRCTSRVQTWSAAN